MRRTPVRSSNIAAIGYNPRSQVLEIEFRNGGVYQYTGVPASVHQALMAAGSHGQYFHNRIKDRYPTTKIR